MLADLLDPIKELKAVVEKKAAMRAEYEGVDPAEAMKKFAYYPCFKCGKPYFGGAKACGAASNVEVKPEHMICVACLPHTAEAECAKHGDEFVEWKCQFCCSTAVFFCFGTTHFCVKCHDHHSEMQQMRDSGKLPHCPSGPRGKQLEGHPGPEDCPLGIHHPPHGTEFCLGCGVCRNAKRDF